MMQAMGDDGFDAGSRAGHPVATKPDFLAFYRLAVGPVYRSASRLVGGDRQRTDDLVQEAFLDLVAQIRAGRITTVDVGWVIVAVRHRFIDSLRRRDRDERRLHLIRSERSATASVDPPGARATEMLGRLPDDQRLAVVLHHVDGYSIGEVAAMLERSPHATESLLARGRDRLRRLLMEHTDDE